MCIYIYIYIYIYMYTYIICIIFIVNHLMKNVQIIMINIKQASWARPQSGSRLDGADLSHTHAG